MPLSALEDIGAQLAASEVEVDRLWYAYREAQDRRNRLAKTWAEFWGKYDGPTEQMPAGGIEQYQAEDR